MLWGEVRWVSDRDAERFVRPDRLWSRAEVLSKPCPIPPSPGVYGWWFRTLPAAIEVSGCVSHRGSTLLYVGISPKAPPGNGRPPSRENVKGRVVTHFAGNAAGSTLRKPLGCLLAETLGIGDRVAPGGVGEPDDVRARRAAAFGVDGRERVRVVGPV